MRPELEDSRGGFCVRIRRAKVPSPLTREQSKNKAVQDFFSPTCVKECTKCEQNPKKVHKIEKIRQNSEVVEINDFPQANLRKKIPACKKSTKFLHWNKISCLRSYNTYTCKQENTNFVRFQVTLCEFCWNFVGQQNSNKILFLLEFYGARGSPVLFRRLYFS